MHNHASQAHALSASFGVYAAVIVVALILAAILSPAPRKLAGRITGSLITGAASAGIAAAVVSDTWRARITAHHLGPDLPYMWGVSAVAVAAVVFGALTSRANSPAIRARHEDEDYRRATARRSRSRADAGRW